MIPQTPLADAITHLPNPISNFHALPASSFNFDSSDNILLQKLHNFYLKQTNSKDVSYSFPILDSFFNPQGPLQEAQLLASRAFKSDRTIFTTCGSTTSNWAAIIAVACTSSRLLIDRSCHQSLHMASHMVSDFVDYAPSYSRDSDISTLVIDLEKTLEILSQAHLEGHPYTAFILTAASYDGSLYRMGEVLPRIHKASPTTRLIIDEAWGGVNSFSKEHQEYSTVNAITQMRAKGADPQALVIHSAHKSLLALRQGSYLHVYGNQDLIEKAENAVRSIHTTSPSWPILASLDLARAHACYYGQETVTRNIQIVENLKGKINQLDHFSIIEPDTPSYLGQDPTKFQIRTTLEVSPQQLRSYLFEEGNIYISRINREHFTINFHIGCSNEDALQLLKSLKTLDSTQQVTPVSNKEVPSSIIIAYPPGIPLLAPGEKWVESHDRMSQKLRADSIDLYSLPTRK